MGFRKGVHGASRGGGIWTELCVGRARPMKLRGQASKQEEQQVLGSHELLAIQKED